MSLSNKIAIVTGGNSGIGQAIVLRTGAAGRARRHRLPISSGGDRGDRAADNQARQPGDRRESRREQACRLAEAG